MDATELLRQLISFDTTNPPGNEDAAVEVLEGHLGEAGLKTTVHRSPAGRPNLVAKLEGPTDRAALVLLSHTDVVGVERDSWTHDPFGAEIADGFVWGRGALDMKGIGAMHAAAAAAVASDGDPQREVIVCAVADEEAGGTEGAKWLVADHADDLGFAPQRPAPEVLGEGAYGLSGILERHIMPIVLGEKTALWVDLIARGSPGHGALPPVDQAPRNLAWALNKVAGPGAPRIHPVMREQFAELSRFAPQPLSAVFRALASPIGTVASRALAARLRENVAISSLLADTATPTQLRAGYKHNVVPGEAHASLDCRILPDTDPDDYVERMRRAVAKRGVEPTVLARHGGPVSGRGPLYGELIRASRELDDTAVVVPSLTSGITDVRYFRARGAFGYGWVPLVVGRELIATIHGHDERVPLDGFQKAVTAMTDVVTRACLVRS